MSICKGCGKEIKWIRTPSGSSIPCDPEEVMYWKQKGGQSKIVTPNGEVVSAELHGLPGTETGAGYIAHFATCPEAKRFRRQP